MKSGFLVVAACLLSVAPAQVIPPNQKSPRTGCGTMAWEGCAGLVGGAQFGLGGAFVGAIIGSAFARGAGFMDLTKEGLVGAGVGAVTGIVLGTATYTWAVGQARNQGGRWGPTLLGALAGTAAGALVVVGAKRAPVIQLVGVLMPATGAVIGYNQSRPEPANGRSFLDRLDFPSVALGSVRDRSGAIHPSLDVKVATVRF